MRDLHPLDRAQRDIDVATYAAIVSGTFTLVMALLVFMADADTPLTTVTAALDVVCSYGLAYGIARRIRAAAIAALALLVLSTVSRLSQGMYVSAVTAAAVFGYCYVRGIRGTFAYRAHRLASTTSAAPRAPAA
jgi:hypothetical protein